MGVKIVQIVQMGDRQFSGGRMSSRRFHVAETKSCLARYFMLNGLYILKILCGICFIKSRINFLIKINFFYKQPVYKQPTLECEYTKQL